MGGFIEGLAFPVFPESPSGARFQRVTTLFSTVFTNSLFIFVLKQKRTKKFKTVFPREKASEITKRK
jgi:hypothetical protein